MKNFIPIWFVLGLLIFFSLAAGGAEEPAATNPCTYVLVHGAWGGSWDWKHVDDLLTADGNKVYRASLTGQGDRSHLASTNIDLATQIQDVVNLIVWDNLHEVVLVGHSYGGMILTGVADEVPGRLKHLVYLDAALPVNGESLDALLQFDDKVICTNGFIVPKWVKGNPPPPHDVPMPAKTLSQPITLTNQAVTGRLPATYILTVDKGKEASNDMFYPFYVRARERGWPVSVMEGDHNVQRSHPDELVRRLEEAAQQN